MKLEKKIIDSIINQNNDINATINECMVANLIYLMIPDEETAYSDELNFTKENSYKEYNQFREGEIIRIIASFKNILNKRKEYYLKNHWGINLEELIADIEHFKQEFINLIKENVEEFYEMINISERQETNFCPENDNSCFGFELSDPYSMIFYGFGMCSLLYDKNLPFMKLFYTLCKQNEELMHKIHDAATKNSEEYIAELRLCALLLDTIKEVSLSSMIEYIKALSKIELNDKVIKKVKAAIKNNYNKSVMEKNFSATASLDIIDFSINNNSFINPLLNLNESENHYAGVHVLCNNKKYIYYSYHCLLEDDSIKEKHKHLEIGKPLYDGYIKWCKKNEIQPLISVAREKLIEYPINVANTYSRQYHFPKKRFIDNPLNNKREELNKAFLKKLLKGMIDEKIIAPDTKDEHFLFVFGYGEDSLKDFKPIEILKPTTNYKRESGKRTIVYLLKDLMGYSDDEIRPTLGKNRHLVINSCFKASPLFKSSDFEDKPASETSEIMKATELLKMKRIFKTALNETENNPLI